MDGLIELGVYFLEILKYAIISYNILGLRPRTGKSRFLFGPIVVILGSVTYLHANYDTLADIILVVSFILIWFDEKIKMSTFYIILEFLSVSFMDLLIWLVCVGTTPWGLKYLVYEDEIYILANVMGLIPWVIMGAIIHKKKKHLRKHLENLRVTNYVLVILLILAMIIVTACLQGEFLGEITLGTQRLVMFASVVLALFVVILCALYIYVADAKSKLLEINRLNEECIEYQKNYYKRVLEKEEELRAFKHDVNKHYNALEILYNEKKYDDIGQYLKKLNESFEVNYIYNTGSVIADYIINGKIKEIKEQTDLKVKVVGGFPNSMKLDNTEICIILANVLDNAKEAIKEYKNNAILEIYIRNFKERLYITVKNSSPKREYKYGNSTKKDKQNHGYGMKNVKRIVDKYDGNLNTRWENGIFTTEIDL